MLRLLVITLALVSSVPAFAQWPAPALPPQAPTLLLAPAPAGPPSGSALAHPTDLTTVGVDTTIRPSFGRALGGSFVGLGAASLVGLASWAAAAELCGNDPWSFCGGQALLAGASIAAGLAPFLMAAGASVLGGGGGGAGYGLGVLGAVLGGGLTVAAGFFATSAFTDLTAAIVFTTAAGLVTTPLLTTLGYMLGASLRDDTSLQPVVAFSGDGGSVGVRGAF